MSKAAPCLTCRRYYYARPLVCRSIADPLNPRTGGVTLTYYGVPPAADAPYKCGNDANGAYVIRPP